MYHLVANLAALAMQEIEGKAKGPLPEPEIDSACKFSRQSMSTQAMLPGRSASGPLWCSCTCLQTGM